MITTTCDVIRYFADDTYDKVQDVIAIEREVHLFAGEQSVLQADCSPTRLKELAAGFFYTEYGFRKDETLKITMQNEMTYQITYTPRTDVKKREVVFRSGRHSNVQRIEPQTAMQVEQQLLEYSEAFDQTGNMHCAALSKGKTIDYVGEDISRHLAVYKAIGACILHGDMPENYSLYITGRMPISMVQIAVHAGIPILVSRSAPSDRSLAYAKKYGLTMYGFASGKRVNVYE